MRCLATLFIVLLVTACGGGGGGASSPADATAAASASPTIHFEAEYTAVDRALAIRPADSFPGIATNAIAKVEVQTNTDAPQVLTAPNGTDAKNRSQYVFHVPAYAFEFPRRTCSPFLPMRVTVTDTGGLSVTKYQTFCPGQNAVFGGFSDYGDRTVRFTLTASAPLFMYVWRFGAGHYDDTVQLASAATLDQSFAAREGDRLTADASGTLPAAAGTRVGVRIDGSGGAFAESAGTLGTTFSSGTTFSGASANLTCCHMAVTAGDSGARRVRITFSSTGAISWSYRVLDASGAAVAQQSGMSGRTDRLPFIFDSRIGYQFVAQVAPTEPDTLAGVNIDNVTDTEVYGNAPNLAAAGSNRTDAPARVSVFCCSL